MISGIHSRVGLIALLLGAAVSGCSIKQMAVKRLGNALSGGSTVFASDNDPELIRSAAPFSLKLMEALLEQSPRHAGLLLACSSGFTQYAFAFVQQEADELEEKDIDAATALRERARRLYLRARDYGLRGLDLGQPQFSRRIREQPAETVLQVRREQVPLLFWTAVSWAAAISVSKDNPELIGELPIVDSLIERAVSLEEAYADGALHSFLIGYELSRRDAPGDPVARARVHFERTVELSGGQLAGPYVSWAEGVSVQKQNRAEFESMLEKALAIDADARPQWRLLNLVLQRRARWLLSRAEELFLDRKPAEQTNP